MATVTAPPPEPAKSAKLDDVMIAMDVVDTVRHREDLVRRELNDAGREAELRQRLKEIYRQQGIDVPDHVLDEGIRALKESRFTYAPPPPGLKRTLLTLWATRERYTKPAVVALTLLLGTCSYHYATVTRPANQAAEIARVEFEETLPRAIRQAHADIAKLTSDAAARQRADALLADGERAIRDRDRTLLTRASADLTALRDEIARDYTLTVVSRPGETSGVWRRPPGNAAQRNYYLIVEAVAPNGQKLKLPILNEENGKTETVDKFGVRVPQETFDRVAADKRDDGIIQNNRVGVKKRGQPAPEFLMPYQGGMITRW
jgi:hypothetical protein